MKDFDAKDYINSRMAGRMECFSQFAAAKEAMEDCKISMKEKDCYQVGVNIGSGVGSLRGIEQEYDKMLEKGSDKISPITVPFF